MGLFVAHFETDGARQLPSRGQALSL